MKVIPTWYIHSQLSILILTYQQPSHSWVLSPQKNLHKAGTFASLVWKIMPGVWRHSVIMYWMSELLNELKSLISSSWEGHSTDLDLRKLLVNLNCAFLCPYCYSLFYSKLWTYTEAVAMSIMVKVTHSPSSMVPYDLLGLWRHSCCQYVHHIPRVPAERPLWWGGERAGRGHPEVW